jgi:hypothetical protein
MRHPLPRSGVCSFLLLVLMNTSRLEAKAVDSEYHVGVGRADVTGPAADVNMMVTRHLLECRRAVTQEKKAWATPVSPYSHKRKSGVR